MPRDAVSRTANIERTGRHKLVPPLVNRILMVNRIRICMQTILINMKLITEYQYLILEQIYFILFFTCWYWIYIHGSVIRNCKARFNNIFFLPVIIFFNNLLSDIPIDLVISRKVFWHAGKLWMMVSYIACMFVNSFGQVSIGFPCMYISSQSMQSSLNILIYLGHFIF